MLSNKRYSKLVIDLHESAKEDVLRNELVTLYQEIRDSLDEKFKLGFKMDILARSTLHYFSPMVKIMIEEVFKKQPIIGVSQQDIIELYVKTIKKTLIKKDKQVLEVILNYIDIIPEKEQKPTLGNLFADKDILESASPIKERIKEVIELLDFEDNIKAFSVKLRVDEERKDVSPAKRAKIQDLSSPSLYLR
jgi:hypothetical protein